MMRSVLTVGFLALSAAASADGFDYDYFSIGYGNIDFDEVGVDGDGFRVKGSYALAPQYHVFADYDGGSLDFGVDVTTWDVGFGYNTSLSDKTDAYARLSYESIEFDVPLEGSFDDSGLGFAVGLRFAASEQLELNGGIKYVDYGDFGDDTGFEAGALYDVSDAFAIGVAGEFSDDVSVYSINGRFYFGR